MAEFLSGINLMLHLKKSYNGMSAVEKKITDYFLSSIEEVPGKTVTEISDICEVSEASIIRFVKKLGFTGFYQMKIELARSMKPDSSLVHHETDADDLQGVMKKSLEIAVNNIRDSYENLSFPDLEKAIGYMTSCNNVYFFAAGNSIPICHDFIYRLGRLGIRGHIADIPEMSLLQARNMKKGDIAFAISHSGDSILVNEALKKIKQRKLPIIAVTNYKKSPIVKWADITIVTAVRRNFFDGSENFTRLSETAILDLLFYMLFFMKKDFYLQYISKTESDQSLYSM